MTILALDCKTPEALTQAAQAARREEHAKELSLAETKFEPETFIKSAAAVFTDSRNGSRASACARRRSNKNDTDHLFP